jgi:hypothetical protein
MVGVPRPAFADTGASFGWSSIHRMPGDASGRRPALVRGTCDRTARPLIGRGDDTAAANLAAKRSCAPMIPWTYSALAAPSAPNVSI